MQSIAADTRNQDCLVDYMGHRYSPSETVFNPTSLLRAT